MSLLFSSSFLSCHNGIYNYSVFLFQCFFDMKLLVIFVSLETESDIVFDTSCCAPKQLC